MSVSKWRYTEECNGRPCPGDCDHCSFEPADLISRADAIEAVMAEGRKVYTSEYANAERIIHEEDAVEALAMLPSADAVQGEWIKTEHCSNENGFKRWIELECPFCGHSPFYGQFDDMNFCPNCGARMKGGGTE